MVQIAGKYILEKSENFDTYLKAIGLPEDLATKAIQPGFTSDISVDGTKYAIKSSSGIELSFTLDKEFEEPMPGGFKLKSLAKLDGDKLVITSKTEDGRSGVRSYEFNDKGYTLVMSASDVTAKRYFVRN